MATGSANVTMARVAVARHGRRCYCHHYQTFVMLLKHRETLAEGTYTSVTTGQSAYDGEAHSLSLSAAVSLSVLIDGTRRTFHLATYDSLFPVAHITQTRAFHFLSAQMRRKLHTVQPREREREKCLLHASLLLSPCVAK